MATCARSRVRAASPVTSIAREPWPAQAPAKQLTRHGNQGEIAQRSRLDLTAPFGRGRGSSCPEAERLLDESPPLSLFAQTRCLSRRFAGLLLLQRIISHPSNSSRARRDRTLPPAARWPNLFCGQPRHPILDRRIIRRGQSDLPRSGNLAPGPMASRGDAVGSREVAGPLSRRSRRRICFCPSCRGRDAASLSVGAVRRSQHATTRYAVHETRRHPARTAAFPPPRECLLVGGHGTTSTSPA
jgi:hypothetical protein